MLGRYTRLERFNSLLKLWCYLQKVLLFSYRFVFLTPRTIIQTNLFKHNPFETTGQEKAKLRNEERKSYDNVYKHSLEHYLALEKDLSNFCELRNIKSLTKHQLTFKSLSYILCQYFLPAARLLRPIVAYFGILVLSLGHRIIE